MQFVTIPGQQLAYGQFAVEIQGGAVPALGTDVTVDGRSYAVVVANQSVMRSPAKPRFDAKVINLFSKLAGGSEAAESLTYVIVEADPKLEFIRWNGMTGEAIPACPGVPSVGDLVDVTSSRGQRVTVEVTGIDSSNPSGLKVHVKRTGQ